MRKKINGPSHILNTLWELSQFLFSQIRWVLFITSIVHIRIVKLRGGITWPGSDSWPVATLVFEPGQSGTNPKHLPHQDPAHLDWGWGWGPGMAQHHRMSTSTPGTGGRSERGRQHWGLPWVWMASAIRLLAQGPCLLSTNPQVTSCGQKPQQKFRWCHRLHPIVSGLNPNMASHFPSGLRGPSPPWGRRAGRSIRKAAQAWDFRSPVRKREEMRVCMEMIPH